MISAYLNGMHLSSLPAGVIGRVLVLRGEDRLDVGCLKDWLRTITHRTENICDLLNIKVVQFVIS